MSVTRDEMVIVRTNTPLYCSDVRNSVQLSSVYSYTMNSMGSNVRKLYCVNTSNPTAMKPMRTILGMSST